MTPAREKAKEFQLKYGTSKSLDICTELINAFEEFSIE
jgi:hypothetical protein